jgi:cobalt-zinc-cadmium resistance protein CzcA
MEAASGVKGQLAIKVYGSDLKMLEEKGDQIVNVMRTISESRNLGWFRVIGQPNLDLTVDRQKAGRWYRRRMAEREQKPGPSRG